MSQSFPLTVGNGADCNAKVNMAPGVMGVFMERAGNCVFCPRTNCRLNGNDISAPTAIPLNTFTMVSHGGGILVLLYTNAPLTPEHQKQFIACQRNQWLYYDTLANTWQGPLPFEQLCKQGNYLNANTWIIIEGMSACMCRGDEILAMNRRMNPTVEQPLTQPTATPSPAVSQQQQQQQQQESTPPEQDDAEIEADVTVDEDNGDFTCPVCWLHFNAGDVMSIASHPDLMGDPVLGREHMLRFYASRFNARGQALDEKGVPCQEMACPHCRRKLPPNFLQMEDFIFSIIGAPSSGKSYYLASLINTLSTKLPAEYGVLWRDADPTGNTMLNDVMFRLFNAPSAETAYLSKTDLEGALYEEFYRHGRMVKLPKPFIYNMSKMSVNSPTVSLVFYDNAGEHFEPGRNNEDSPGAQHVAVASGLFFLFDPTTSRPFRPLIHQDDDPQLDDNGVLKMDQQAVILAETGIRIASILNLPMGDKISTPLAVMIGKSDLWEDNLESPLLPIVEDGVLIQANVDANSASIRKMMMKVLPALCSSAESISTTVRYFAVSPLGCSPVRFTDPATQSVKIGPDPTQINPRHIEDPTLWVLSRIVPELIPSR